MGKQRRKEREKLKKSNTSKRISTSRDSMTDLQALEPPADLCLDDRTQHLLVHLLSREPRHTQVTERQRLHAHLLRTISQPSQDEPGVWYPQTIKTYLLSCETALEIEARNIARRLPPALWLWCLRHRELVTFGDIDPGENQGITDTAVVLSALEADRITAFDGIAASMRLNDQDMERMERLCVIAQSLRYIATLLGLTALDVTFSFGAYNPWPNPHVPDATREAIDLVMTRWRNNPYPLSHFGALIADLAPRQVNYDDYILLVGRMQLPSQITWTFPGMQGRSARYWTLPWTQTQGGNRLYTMPGGRARAALVAFVVAPVSLRSLAEIASHADLAGAQWSDDLGALLLYLRLVTACMLSQPWLDDAWTCGYLAIDEQDFSTRVAAQIESEAALVRAIVPSVDVPSSIAELFAVLSGDNARIRPRAAGPVIRRAGNTLYLDLYSATRRLEQRLFLPAKDGEVANVPSAHFELAVQSMIDHSSWAPPEHLRDLRGKTLILNGKPITEIDAIGARDDTLLLVDCKSLRITEDFQNGDYDAIRNARTAVEGKPNPKKRKDKGFVAVWQEHCETLRANPLGDYGNYDFRHWPKIVPVVCLPQAVYLSIGLATREVAPGLRAAAVAYELEAWLAKPE